MRILIVEDQKKIASFIERGLKEEGYAVDVALDGIEGEWKALNNDYDLIILDIMLPGKDGIEICKSLKKNGVETPILILTAKDSVRDKVIGLDSGADDYLTKPFAFEELLARIRALLRRKKIPKNDVLQIADLKLDRLKREVWRGNKKIELTSKEYALLEYLMLNAGNVVTRTMISEHVWNENFDSFTNVIDVYINYLRNKIDKGFGKKLIHTLRGAGYILKEE